MEKEIKKVSEVNAKLTCYEIKDGQAQLAIKPLALQNIFYRFELKDGDRLLYRSEFVPNKRLTYGNEAVNPDDLIRMLLNSSIDGNVAFGDYGLPTEDSVERGCNISNNSR